MITKKLRRTLVGAVAAGAVVLCGSPSAHANTGNERLTLSSGRGSVTHIDDGDHFMVCDLKADGAGVSGALWEQFSDGSATIVARYDDGGDAGCDQITYDIKTGHTYFMTLRWNGSPSSTVSESMYIWE
ncbi:hypothetical protein [Streptomyces aureus]|uniref:hypothetical protein n=1 Tax=Streptomyces aureus TaxID=193461 RepID=UPI000691B6C6|nr:hypothetical protein [Streptomyces aureus]